MVFIKKKEAKKNKCKDCRYMGSHVCEFHEHNPDQTASMYECLDCHIIREPCGCDEEMECEICNPKAFKKDARLLPKVDLMNDNDIIVTAVSKVHARKGYKVYYRSRSTGRFGTFKIMGITEWLYWKVQVRKIKKL